MDEERQMMTIRLPRPLYGFLVRHAQKEGRTLNGEVKVALENWARIQDPNYLDPVNQPQP